MNIGTIEKGALTNVRLAYDQGKTDGVEELLSKCREFKDANKRLDYVDILHLVRELKNERL